MDLFRSDVGGVDDPDRFQPREAEVGAGRLIAVCGTGQAVVLQLHPVGGEEEDSGCRAVFNAVPGDRDVPVPLEGAGVILQPRKTLIAPLA